MAITVEKLDSTLSQQFLHPKLNKFQAHLHHKWEHAKVNLFIF